MNDRQVPGDVKGLVLLHPHKHNKKKIKIVRKYCSCAQLEEVARRPSYVNATPLE